MTKFVFTIVPAILFLTCMFSEAMALEPLRIQLKWHHQSQFAGFYVAQEKQFYRTRGIQASFLEGGPGIGLIKPLLNHTADFSICAPEDVILKKSQGFPVRAIAAIYRKSAVVYLSRKNSGIRSPIDFQGKTIAVVINRSPADFVFQFNALMRNLKIDTATIKKVPYDPRYIGFKNGSVDITPAYFTGGLVKLKAQGVPTNIIYPGDYRVRFYSDTLVAHDQLIHKKPDLISRFVKASIEGWQYAIENIEETTDIVMKYARIKDRNLQKQMLEAAIPLIYNGGDPIGWMHRQEWEHMHQILVEQNLIPSPANDPDIFFTTQFVTQAYTKKQP